MTLKFLSYLCESTKYIANENLCVLIWIKLFYSYNDMSSNYFLYTEVQTRI